MVGQHPTAPNQIAHAHTHTHMHTTAIALLGRWLRPVKLLRLWLWLWDWMLSVDLGVMGFELRSVEWLLKCQPNSLVKVENADEGAPFGMKNNPLLPSPISALCCAVLRCNYGKGKCNQQCKI
eukprot:5184174-Amphidinium_carterae.1